MQRPAQFLQPADLDRLRRREPAAVADEIRAHGPAVAGASRGLGLSSADAEEVSQGVWATFLEILPRFEGRSQVRTYLFGILRRKAAELRRQSARAEPTDPVALHDLPATPSADAEALLAADERGRAVQNCVGSLPEKERRAVELKFFGDAETADVGRALGITANYLGVLLHRARAHLRDCLGAHLR